MPPLMQRPQVEGTSCSRPAARARSIIDVPLVGESPPGWNVFSQGYSIHGWAGSWSFAPSAPSGHDQLWQNDSVRNLLLGGTRVARGPLIQAARQARRTSMRRTQHGLGQWTMAAAAALMAASCAGEVDSAGTGGQSSGQNSGDDRIASIFAN